MLWFGRIAPLLAAWFPMVAIMRSLPAILFPLISGLCGACGPARAADVGEFWRGRTISLILSMGADGGYAAYARTFAPWLRKHVPGAPNIVVQEMPGAGGLRAMQHFAHAAPRDGSTIGLVYSSNPFAPLFGLSGANFDPREMNWIGAMSHESSVCAAWAASGVATWNDLLSKEFIVGTTGAGSIGEIFSVALNRFFGAKIRIVSGYKSANDVYLAMERGEAHGYCGTPVASLSLLRPGWLESGKLKIPVQMAPWRDARIPDTPTVIELATDNALRRTLALMLSSKKIDRPLLAPPGVPLERVAALREAFQAAINDSGFLAEARRQGMAIDPTPGEDVARIIAESYEAPADIVRNVREVINPGGGGR